MSDLANNFYAAEELVDQLLEADSVKDFLLRHNITRTRQFWVKPDPSQDGYFQIPVLDHGASRRFVRLFRPETNPKLEIKNRLQQLLRTRKGYAPGDVFNSPWGRFLVTDALGLKEI